MSRETHCKFSSAPTTRSTNLTTARSNYIEWWHNEPGHYASLHVDRRYAGSNAHIHFDCHIRDKSRNAALHVRSKHESNFRGGAGRSGHSGNATDIKLRKQRSK